MTGIVGVVLLVTFLIAGAVAGRRGQNAEPPSAGRFILRFIIAWVVLVMVAALLLFGACVVMLGSLGGGGCINC
jgi:hypothetical protein